MLLLRKVIVKSLWAKVRDSYEAFATGDEKDLDGDREAAR